MKGENYEPASVDYPTPQATVEAARDVGPPIEPVVAMPPDTAIDVDFVEVGGSDEPGLGRAALDYLMDRVLPEIADTAYGKFIDGRDEFANAIFNQSAYWPGQHPTELEVVPVDMSEASIQGPAIEPPQVEANGYQVFGPEIKPAVHDEFNAMLAEAAQRSISYDDRDMGMDH